MSKLNLKNINYLNHIIAILVIAFIFGPPLTFLPTFINIGVFSALLLTGILYIIFPHRKITISKRLLLAIISLSSIFLLQAIYSVILFNGENYEFIEISFRLVLFCLFASFIAIIMNHNKNSIFLIFHYYLLFIILNSLVILLEPVFPIITNFINDNIYDSSNLKKSSYVRYKGLVTFGGATLSMFNALYVFILILIWSKLNQYQKLFYIVFVPIVILSTFLIGRSGLIILPIIIFGYAIIKRKYIYFNYLAVIGLLLISLSYCVHHKIIDVPTLNKPLEQSLEPIINPLFTQKKEMAGTLKSLKKMMYLPQDKTIMILGEGTFSKHTPPEGNYKVSDSGFVRHIYGIGIIFSLLMWWLLFKLKVFLTFERRYYYLLLLLILFIMNIKEHFLFKAQFFKFFVIMFFIFVLIETTYKKVNKDTKNAV